MTDLYAEVAGAAGVPVPDDDMAPFELRLDRSTFDPRTPDQEARRTVTLLETPEVDRAPGSAAPPLVPPRGRSGIKSEAASTVGAGAAGLAVLVGLWAMAAASVQELPSPAATFSQLSALLPSPCHDNGPNDKGIAVQLAASLTRVFKGFALAAAVGVPSGLLLGARKWAWRAASPLVQLLRPVSPLAWFPIWLVILWTPPRRRCG